MRWTRVLNVVGCQAEGEVGNVITGGIGDVPGGSVFEKRLYLERELDNIRKLLLFGLDPSDPFPEGYTLSDTWLRAL